MKNVCSVPSFLHHRECGSGSRTWQQKRSVDTFIESLGATPIINQQCALSGQCRATFLMDFSPDGSRIASTHGDHTVRVTEVSTGKCTHVLKGHPRTPWCIAFHPSSNQILASGCLGGEVRIWDLHGFGSEVWKSKENYVIASLAFHPTDHVLVFAVANTIYFWDWSHPEPFTYCKTKHNYERIRWLNFDPLGHFLYTGIANDTAVQPSNSSRVSFMRGNQSESRPPGQQSRPPGQQSRLSQMYDHLVECFQVSRRDRILGQNINAPTTAQSIPPEEDNPRSPVHEEALSMARQYAAHITESASQNNSPVSTHTILANQSDGHVTTTTDSSPNERREEYHAGASDASHPLNTSSNHSSDFQRPYNWSPPPRGASAETDSDVIVEEEISLSASNFPSLLASNPVLGSSRDPSLNVLGMNGTTATRIHSTLRYSSNVTNSSVADKTGTVNQSVSSDRQAQSPFVAISEASRVVVVPESQASGVNTTSTVEGEGRTGLFSFSQRRSRSGSKQSQNPISGSVSSNKADDSTSSVSYADAVRVNAETDWHDLHRSAAFTERKNNSGTNLECDTDCQICGRYNRRSILSHEESSSTRLRSRRKNWNGSQRSAFSRPDSRNLRCHRYATAVSSPAARNLNFHPAMNMNENIGASTSVVTGSQSVNVTVDSSSESAHVNSIQDDSSHNAYENASQDPSHTSTSENINGYDRLHENFATITSRIEQEMNELDRRINALRSTFNESVRRFQQGRGMINVSRESSNTETASSSSNIQQVAPPVIRITRCDESARSSSQGGASTELQRSEVPTTTDSGQPMLESALRANRRLQSNIASSRSVQEDVPSHSWQSLERHHLHPHYSVSILDNTINRPNDPIQIAINRTIADAFMGRGDPAVATNIINQTHRIQAWDFTRCDIPDISDSKVNIIVQHCKLHNEASCDISRDGTMLATFVPSHRGFPDDNILAVYSLLPKTRGQCLFTKSFGPNAISVSLSPLNNYVMVGLAAKRLSWVFTPNQLVAKILKLEKKEAGENSMQLVTDVMHPCDMDIRSHVSVNSARWMPGPGEGIVYGTNRGDLHICRPGATLSTKGDFELLCHADSIRRNLFNLMRGSGYESQNVLLTSSATQTPGVRRSASTQTDTSINHE